jgi:hypothetical protein
MGPLHSQRRCPRPALSADAAFRGAGHSARSFPDSEHIGSPVCTPAQSRRAAAVSIYGAGSPASRPGPGAAPGGLAYTAGSPGRDCPPGRLFPETVVGCGPAPPPPPPPPPGLGLRICHSSWATRLPVTVRARPGAVPNSGSPALAGPGAIELRATSGTRPGGRGGGDSEGGGGSGMNRRPHQYPQDRRNTPAHKKSPRR